MRVNVQQKVCYRCYNLSIFPLELRGKLQQYHWKANLHRRLLKMVGVRNGNCLWEWLGLGMGKAGSQWEISLCCCTMCSFQSSLSQVAANYRLWVTFCCSHKDLIIFLTDSGFEEGCMVQRCGGKADQCSQTFPECSTEF